MQATQIKTAGDGHRAAAQETTQRLNRSTSTAAQERRIIEALRLGPKTTDDLRAIGCYQVSARIFGLRRRGYDIETYLFDGYSVDGFSHRRMARYRLLGEPEVSQ